MQKNLLAQIKTDYEFMSAVEKKIADVILTDAKNFTTCSMQELSGMTGVSQGSINNFANKFTGGGFPYLKLQVATSIPSSENFTFSGVEKSDSLKDVLRKRTDSVCEALKRTVSVNDESALSSVAEKIMKAKMVDIYGLARSAVVATDMSKQLLKLGIRVNFSSDVLTCAVSASLLTEDCLVVAISMSGRTKDVIDAVNIAKKNNVPIACITANRNSPLAKISDDVLVASSSGCSVVGAGTEIRVSQLLIIDAICEYIRNKLDETGEKYFAKVEEILNSHSVED